MDLSQTFRVRVNGIRCMIRVIFIKKNSCVIVVHLLFICCSFVVHFKVIWLRLGSTNGTTVCNLGNCGIRLERHGKKWENVGMI